MQTTHYGGKSRDYRFGWNITNPAGDAEWTTWSTTRSAPPHALDAGTEEFWLQARDHLGLRTTGRIAFLK
jgi:hypothetical protein